MLTTNVCVIGKWCHITLSVGKTAGRKPLSSVKDCTGRWMRRLEPSVTAVRMPNLTHQYFPHIFCGHHKIAMHYQNLTKATVARTWSRVVVVVCAKWQNLSVLYSCVLWSYTYVQAYALKCVCAYVRMCHQNLILDSAGRKRLLFALPFRFCGAFFREWITGMESLLQYNIISNIIDVVTVLLVTFMLQFRIGGADPQSDDAQEKSLSTIWSLDLFSYSWSSVPAMLNSKKVLQLSPSMEKSPSRKSNSNTVAQELPELYGTPRFTTEFTSVHHLSLTWARTIQSTPTPPNLFLEERF